MNIEDAVKLAISHPCGDYAFYPPTKELRRDLITYLHKHGFKFPTIYSLEDVVNEAYGLLFFLCPDHKVSISYKCTNSKMKVIEIIKEEIKMNIEDAVKYCLNHKAVIHTPTKDIYNSLMSYLDETDIKWKGGNIPSSFSFRDRRVDDICINFSTNIISYAEPNYYTNKDYEIIELTSVSIDNTIYYNKEDAVNKIESIFSSFPSAGDIYYWINSEGEVTFDEWVNDYIDKNHLAIGNCYKTEEDAESVIDRVIKAYKG